MTDTSNSAPSEMATLFANLKSELLSELKANVVPLIESAAQTAVQAYADSVPVIGPLVQQFVPAAFDEIDTLVSQLLGKAIPKAAPASPVDPLSQIASLQAHVAALTVATGAQNSVQFQQAKTQALQSQPPASQRLANAKAAVADAAAA
jgi:hypothetical protein